MKNIFVSEQVQILLQRMNDYPEDFFDGVLVGRGYAESVWQRIVILGDFNVVEGFLIKRKYTKIKRQMTKQLILEKLVEGNTKAELEANSAPTFTIPSGRDLVSERPTTHLDKLRTEILEEYAKRRVNNNRF